MITTKIYNDSGELITPQQVVNASDYHIKTYDNGKLKQIEYYIEGNQCQIDYYKQEYQSGKFILYRIETYNNDILTFVFRELKDDYGNELCVQQFDIKTELAILKSTEKNLFIKNELVLSFDYDETGALTSVWNGWVQGTDQWLKGTIYKDQIYLYFPSLLTDHPYYINANILPISV